MAVEIDTLGLNTHLTNRDLGFCLYRLQRYEEAKSVLPNAFGHRDFLAAYKYMGHVCFCLGLDQDALRCYKMYVP